MPHDFINEAQQVLIDGQTTLDQVLPNIIKRIIRDELWRQQKDQNGEPFKSFKDFCEYKLWWGLECPFDRLRHHCQFDPECTALLLAQIDPTGQHGGDRKSDQAQTTKRATKGGRADYFVARLKRDAQTDPKARELLDSVLSGKIAVNAAALAMGYRKKANPVERVMKELPTLSAEDKAMLYQALHSQTTPDHPPIPEDRTHVLHTFLSWQHELEAGEITPLEAMYRWTMVAVKEPVIKLKPYAELVRKWLPQVEWLKEGEHIVLADEFIEWTCPEDFYRFADSYLGHVFSLGQFLRGETADPPQPFNRASLDDMHIMMKTTEGKAGWLCADMMSRINVLLGDSRARSLSDHIAYVTEPCEGYPNGIWVRQWLTPAAYNHYFEPDNFEHYITWGGRGGLGLTLLQAKRLIDFEACFDRNASTRALDILRRMIPDFDAKIATAEDRESKAAENNRRLDDLKSGQAIVCSVRKKRGAYVDFVTAEADRLGKLVMIDRKTIWGNPFEITKDSTRAEVCARFESDIKQKPDLLERLPELKGKALGCWCYPDQCHGDVLARLANES